jgi:Choline/Carnitine o-acyltransferase
MHRYLKQMRTIVRISQPALGAPCVIGTYPALKSKSNFSVFQAENTAVMSTQVATEMMTKVSSKEESSIQKHYSEEDGSWLEADGGTPWPTSFPETLRHSPLFAHQSRLAHLPVPTLQATMARLLATSVPLLDADAYKRLLELVKNLLDETASAAMGRVSGRTLQMRLLARAEQKPSWLLEYWNEAAYLRDRSPLPIFVSYFFAFSRKALEGAISSTTPPQGTTTSLQQTKVASHLVAGVLRWYSALYNGTLQPDKDARGEPLCSHMYRFLFHTCRIPRTDVDTVHVYPPSANSHIIIMSGGHIYALNVLDSQGNILKLTHRKCDFFALILFFIELYSYRGNV